MQGFEMQELRKKNYQEELDRVTAVQHIQTDHFSKHVKPEGYYDNVAVGQAFGCDRLMKMESMFSRIQLGYNAARGRSFIFAELKTSRYDTVSSRYQRAMKEYQMNSRQNGANIKRAFVSRKKSETALLLEKGYAKPWSEEIVHRYYNRINMDVLAVTMPCLDRKHDWQQLEELKNEQRRLQEQIQDNTNKGEFQVNAEFRQKQVDILTEENLLQHLLMQKESASRNFMNKINLVYETQKHQIFEYYKNKEKDAQKASEATDAVAEDEDKEEH